MSNIWNAVIQWLLKIQGYRVAVMDVEYPAWAIVGLLIVVLVWAFVLVVYLVNKLKPKVNIPDKIYPAEIEDVPKNEVVVMPAVKTLDEGAFIGKIGKILNDKLSEKSKIKQILKRSKGDLEKGNIEGAENRYKSIKGLYYNLDLESQNEMLPKLQKALENIEKAKKEQVPKKTKLEEQEDSIKNVLSSL